MGLSAFNGDGAEEEEGSVMRAFYWAGAGVRRGRARRGAAARRGGAALRRLGGAFLNAPYVGVGPAAVGRIENAPCEA
jgi:hypothetical protein